MQTLTTLRLHAAALRLTAGAVGATVLLLAACSPPPPRSYDFFMEDSIARDGALARCDQDPVASQTDIECANARRAGTAVLLREERSRRQALEQESERKLQALRQQIAVEQMATREAELAAAAAAQAAYEAQWIELDGTPEDAGGTSGTDAGSSTPMPGVPSAGAARAADDAG